MDNAHAAEARTMPATLTPVRRPAAGSATESDAALLERYTRQRDDAAFAALVARHGPLVLGVCRRVLGDPHAADDAYQAALLVLARRAAAVPPGALAGWLHGVAYRVALKARSRRATRTSAAAGEPADPRPDPLAQLSARELVTAIDDEVQRLAPSYRLPVVLCCLEGHTQEEAAAVLGCSSGAVKGRLERGRARLHARLVKRGLTLWAALAAVEWSRAAAGAAVPAYRAAASPTAAALAAELLRDLAAARGKTLVALLLALAVTAASLGAFALCTAPGETQEPDPPPPAAQALKDRHGDPLPPGALARLGTVRLRAVASDLLVSGDGKTLLTVTNARNVARWDAATGALLSETHLPTKAYGTSALSPDGTLLAAVDYSQGQDYGIGVWDVATLKRVHFFKRQQNPMAFTPDGKTLVTSRYENGTTGNRGQASISTWDLATGKETVLATMATYARGLCVSPDGKRVAAAGDNRSVRCWDLASGKQLWDSEHAAEHVALSADGKTVCTDTYLGGPLHLFDADTGKRVGTLGKPRDEERLWTMAIALSPDGKYAAQATSQETLVFDIAARKLLYRVKGAGPQVAFAADSKTLYTAGALLLRWDAATGKLLYPDSRPDGHAGPVTSLAFAPDGRSLATTGQDGTVRLWKVADGSHQVIRTDAALHGARSLSGRPDDLWGVPAVAVRFTPDGLKLLTDVAHDTLVLTDLATGKEVQRFKAPSTDEYYFVLSTTSLGGDGSTVIALGQAFERRVSSSLRERTPPQPLCIWDAATGKLLKERKVAAAGWGGKFSPNGRLLLGQQGQLVAVASGAERKLTDVPVNSGPPQAFSPDGRLLAVTDPHVLHGPMAAILVVETATGRKVCRIDAPLGYCRALEFSPDGRLLAAAGDDALHVWEAATGKRVLHLTAKGRLTQWDGALFARCLAFAPDGKSLATGHDDGTVLLWDVAPALANLKPPAGEVDAAACWADLLDPDAAKGQAAIERLASSPAKALPLLKEKLTPVVVEPKWLATKLEELGSDKFAVREAAMRDLEKVAGAVESDLRKALEKPPSLEVRDRLLRLLKIVEAAEVEALPAAEVRQVRAVAVLERIGNAEARALLRELANGAPDARVTRAAKGALGRLAR
jgi:RNA polymerase sigma factor (sigma-70 family)